MKEAYIAPEMEIMTFVPVEKLANSFWKTWGTGASTHDAGGSTPPESGDFELPLG